MPNLSIGIADFTFDDLGRVKFTNLAKSQELGDLLSTAHTSNTNSGCQNNGCGNNGSCNEASFMSDEVSLPGMDGAAELSINNDSFIKMMKKIKQDGVDTSIFVKTFVSE